MPEIPHILLVESELTDGVRLRGRLDDSAAPEALVVECTSIAQAETELARSLVDLIVVVGSAPDIGLVAAVTQLKFRAPGTALVAMSDDDEDAMAAIEAGAEDWLPRTELSDVVLQRRLRLALARHASERALRGREQELRLLFDHNPSPVLVYRMDNLRFLAVNDAAAQLYGYSREELLQMTLEDIRHPDDVAKMREVFAAGIPDHYHAGVWRHRLRDGTSVYVDINVHVLLFRGVPARMSHLRDITVQRQAQRAMEDSEKRFRDLFQHSLGFICIHDLDGQLLSINPAAAKSLGYSVGELLGTSLQSLIPEERRTNFPGYLERLRKNGSDRGLLVLCHRDGSLRTWQYHNRLIEEAEGNASVMGSAQDITSLREAEEAARHSEQQIRMITDALPMRVAYLDTALRFVFVNGLYERLYGRHRSQIVGRQLSEILDAETMAARLPYLERALAGQRQHFEVERSGLGQPCFDELTLLPDVAIDGQTVLGLYVMAQNVTMQKQEEQRLVELAQVDSLTGLLNRSGLMARLHRALERSDDQHSSLAVLYMDLDGFKPVNDVYGHAVGDWVLQSVAGRLQNVARASDSLGRLGGDEFVLVMEGMADSQPAIHMAQRILETLAQPLTLREDGSEQRIEVGISMGIAVHDAAHEDAAKLLKRADAALYEAKCAGRGIWRMAN